MSSQERSAIGRYALAAGVAWSMIVGGSCYWSYHLGRQFTLELARSEAFANINKDLSFRRWATGHGGVYVPPDEKTPPNVYLRVPRRDVETRDGEKLTLMNPAYMVRQMQGEYSENFGVRGHITSRKPMNPGNAADAWEAETLALFERGEATSISAVADIDGKPYMRAMQAMKTESGCLKCHGYQGYEEGDVRGGISASVPLEPYLVRERAMLGSMVSGHAAIWLVGLAAIAVFYSRALTRQRERLATENQIRELNESLDLRVQQRTAELERANRELESFSYSVSHDLRAPLRAISGFSRLLEEDEAQRLSEDGKGMLQRISASAQRMGLLIDDILEFSRIGRHAMKREKVDMTAVVRNVVDELRASYETARIDIAELPGAVGDAAMLRRVWSNLVENALKFSSKREQPHVEIGVETTAGETVFFVRDNGVGFEMQHAGRLFGVFERMHAADEFPGTGAGLAIVKRIVERHGGRVWAQAEDGKGATFRFSLAA